jgi:hypothetical protein
MKMIDLVTACSDAYSISLDLTHASSLAKIIRTWFIDNETKMNPDLSFSQFHADQNKPSNGRGLFDLNNLWRIHDALVLLRGTSVWTSSDETAILE